MISKLFIHGYGPLVNFEIRPGDLSLLLGDNGSGKSSVLAALSSLRSFATGRASLPECFPQADLTVWLDVPELRIELEAVGNEGTYTYIFLAEYRKDGSDCRVLREALLYDGAPLLDFREGTVQLYRDDHSEGPSYTFDWHLSALATIQQRHDNTRLTWFRKWLERILILQALPPVMRAEAPRARTEPGHHFQNFITWYAEASQDQAFAIAATRLVSEVLPGFSHFSFEPTGSKMQKLYAVFTSESGSSYRYDFGSLSDGERMLICLYCLVALAETPTDGIAPVLAVDEPDNFLALTEIQPWLRAIYDATVAGSAQCMLISHHPEFIDFLAEGKGILFSREPNSPVRTRRLDNLRDGGVSVSEKAARRWLDR